MSRFLRKKIILLLPFLLVGVFLFGNFAHAATWASGIVSSVLGFIGLVLVSIGGGILTALMMILVVLASYNDFITEAPITYGWVVIRDVCNMFFILIFLVISFATILRLESYNAKKMIPKLVLMAILINFSKTICGLIIDASQVVTLTFVDAFREAAGGNLANLLGINDLMKIKANGKEDVDAFSIAGAVILAVLYVAIAIIVVGALVVTLAFRTIMLWIYIVLSPLAYLCASFPQGKGYASKWWEDFTKYVVVGPVLAFFIWLSLASMGSVNIASKVGTDKVDGGGGASADAMGSEELTSSITQAGSYDHMLSFVIGVAMLVGGLMMAQQAGGAAGGAAGKAMGMIQSGKNWAQKKASDNTVGRATDMAKSAASSAWGTARGVASGLDQMTGNTISGLAKGVGKVGGGALKGAAGGAAIGAIGGPIGMAIGAGIGGVLGTFKSGMDKFQGDSTDRRNIDKQLIDNNLQMDRGESVIANGVNYDWDEKTETYKDKKGNIHTGAGGENVHRYKGDETKKGENGDIYKWNEDEGVYKNTKEGMGHDVLKENDKAVGRYGDIVHKGENYRRMDDGKFYKINDDGRVTDKKNPENVATNYKDGAAAVGTMFMDLKAIKSNTWQKYKTGYYDATEKGSAIKQAAEDEKIQKEAKNYSGMSDDMINNLLKYEKDSSKKMAMALTLGLRNGFKDHKQLNNAKDALSGNASLLKQFNDAMNKSNMTLNNTTRDGHLNEAAITKLVSSGKASWKDQDTKGLTSESLALMAKHDPDNFAKTITSMSNKTDKDKKNLEKHLSGAIGNKALVTDDIRKAFAKVTGKYSEAFNGITNKNDAILDAFNGITNISDFGDIDKNELTKGDLDEAIQGLTHEDIKKIAKSDKINKEKIKLIVKAYYKKGGVSTDEAVENYRTAA